MERRQIGRTALTASPVGLGCVTFGREIHQAQAWRILDHALDHGITFFDTSENYGGGDAKRRRLEQYGTTDTREVTTEMSSSEKILGRWLRQGDHRQQLVLCTKATAGVSPEAIHTRVEGSLERLQVDSIDVYKLHGPDSQIPIGETLAALHEQVTLGRVRVVGCSNFSASQLQQALDVSRAQGTVRFEITQPPYSLADRSAETALLPLCAREQIAVTSYSPLAAGFLTGKYEPAMAGHRFPQGSRFDVSPAHADVYFSERNFRVVACLRRRAAESGLPMVRLAMAWALSQPLITSVLIGARTTAQIDNALAALQLGLSPQQRDEMSAWS